MSHWYRSLYWRIAAGFVLCLAVMLVVQAVLFVWVSARAGPPLAGQRPGRLARLVADDLSLVLEREPALDIGAHLRTQYGREPYLLLVVLSDGRAFSNGRAAAPPPLVTAARETIALAERRWPDRPHAGDGAGRGDALESGRPDDGPQRLRGRGLTRPPVPAVILVNGRPAGVVFVPPRPPFGFLLGQYAPRLALVALGTLAAGALVGALAVFGPARRRLRAVEAAAYRLGSGDLTARAPDEGGDEVAAVGHAFNTMADGLAERAAALAEAQRLRRQLLADVSHELTTPVTAMRGYLETLAMPALNLDASTRGRYLEIVADETNRLERIIGDLLDLARLEDGGGSFTFGAASTGELFARVAARHERDAGEVGVRIVTRVDSGAETVHGDGGRLGQALENLTANALRYAPRGTVVELSAQPRSDAIVLTVTDHGPGIEPAHLPRVFDRFYKVDAARAQRAEGKPTTASGSGLGLSIVKAIVERHRGRVTVTSEPGRTTFALTLPRPPPQNDLSQ